jgi:hypothetical protein
MSTTISISTGPLSASRTFANDTKAQATLLAFYQAYNLGPADATNTAKLQAVVDYMLNLVAGKAQQLYVEQARDSAVTGAQTTYGFED